MINWGLLKEIKDLREVWPHEALDFTPWLAQESNLALLADAVGLEITVDETESKADIAIPKYLFYVLKNKEQELNDMKRGAGVPHISGEALQSILLPLPSIKKQERIVSILDRFDALCNDLTNGLPAETVARRKQYEYYRDNLLAFN